MGAIQQNYEDVTVYDLDPADEERLLLTQNECTFIWSNREGWPVGVVMSYIWRHGRFWLTASRQRARISAVRRDPRVSVVVSSTGSPLARNQTVTWKGLCTVRDDQDTKRWFYPAFAAAVQGTTDRQPWFEKFLDSPRRVILEVEPRQRIAFDGKKMHDVTTGWIGHHVTRGAGT